MNNKIIKMLTSMLAIGTLIGCNNNDSNKENENNENNNIDENHTHDFSIINFDSNGHWNECSCGEKEELISHSLIKKTDKEKHWKECECGYVCDEYNHTFVNKVIIPEYNALPADYGHASLYYYSCDCGEHSDECFSVGEPLTHTHLTNYKGECSYEGCEANLCIDLSLGQNGSFLEKGNRVFKFEVPFVGEYKFYCDFSALGDNGKVSFYDAEGNLLFERGASNFSNYNQIISFDKVETIYIKINALQTYGYLNLGCNHVLDFKGDCTKCKNYSECIKLNLGENDPLPMLNYIQGLFSFTAPSSGTYKITGISTIHGNEVQYVEACDSNNEYVDFSNGEFVVEEGKTYYFKIVDNKSGSDNVVFTIEKKN